MFPRSDRVTFESSPRITRVYENMRFERKHLGRSSGYNRLKINRNFPARRGVVVCPEAFLSLSNRHSSVPTTTAPCILFINNTIIDYEHIDLRRSLDYRFLLWYIIVTCSNALSRCVQRARRASHARTTTKIPSSDVLWRLKKYTCDTHTPAGRELFTYM